jgi:hypothetical protein
VGDGVGVGDGVLVGVGDSVDVFCGKKANGSPLLCPGLKKSFSQPITSLGDEK